MKNLIAVLILMLISSIPTYAANSDTLTVIVDLEGKITQKVRTIIMPVDPEAIVYTTVNVKKVDTELLGTQMTAVGILSTGDIQKIEEADIDSIQVAVLTTLPNFPKEVSKIIESSIVNISKKGKVQISKMDPMTVELIKKQKESDAKRDDEARKVNAYAGQIYKLFGVFLGTFLLGLGLIQFLRSRADRKSQFQAIQLLAEKMDGLKPKDSGAGSASLVLPPNSAAASASGGGGSGGSLSGGSITSDENPVEKMSTASLRSLMADAYWCEKDGYASWVWSQLSPDKKLELIESWSQLRSYSIYLNQVEPQSDRYHQDSIYLKPHNNHHLSNEDLLNWVQKNPSAWGQLSLMRRQSIPLGLAERVKLMKWLGNTEEVSWSPTASKARVLPTQLDIARLSDQDEEVLYSNSNLLPASLRRQFPSMVWVALLPESELDKLLQTVPAQNLAEVWVGPADALKKIKTALPEKKRELLEDYSKKIPANRESAWLKSLSDAALDILDHSASKPEMKAA